MARAFASGSSQYLSAATLAFSNKLSIVMRMYVTSALGPQRGLVGKTQDNLNDWLVEQEDGYIVFFWATASTGSYQIAYAGPVFSLDTWYTVVIVYDGTQSTDATKLKMWVNGAAQTLTFAASPPTSLRNTSSAVEIGRAKLSGNSAGYTYHNGGMAELALYDVALSDGEAASLTDRSPILIRKGLAYWPLIGRADPEPDVWGGVNATNTNTTNAAHPRVYYSSGIMVGVTTAAAAEFAAAGTLSLTGAASISTAIQMAAAGTASITGSAALSTAIEMAAAGNLSMVGAADLSTGVGLAAAASLSLTGAAALSTAIEMQAAGTLSIVGTAALDTGVPPWAYGNEVVARGASILAPTCSEASIVAPSADGGSLAAPTPHNASLLLGD